jgi:hypothetical protein
MLYAVCTECTFLRAFSRRARKTAVLSTCPVCGAELVLQGKPARFQPTYVSRVSLELHAAPPLAAAANSGPGARRSTARSKTARRRG